MTKNFVELNQKQVETLTILENRVIASINLIKDEEQQKVFMNFYLATKKNFEECPEIYLWIKCKVKLVSYRKYVKELKLLIREIEVNQNGNWLKDEINKKLKKKNRTNTTNKKKKTLLMEGK